MIRAFNGKTPKIAKSAYISEAAYIVGDVEIGEGCSVWPGAVIRADFGKITIGNNSTIEDNCVVHSGSPQGPMCDADIGNEVHIGHAAVCNGRRIGNNVLVGMNATILHDVEIGNSCIIGACCLVTEGMKVPDNSFVVGVPGKIKEHASEMQSYWTQEAPRIYADLAGQYLEEQKSGNPL